MLGDLRYAFRKLIANPGFTAVAVVILAAAIGAATSVFSVVNGVLLRPLPGVADAERLVTLTRVQTPDTFDTFGYPDYVDYRDRNRTFTGLAAHSGAPLAFSNGNTARVRGDLVTGNYFQVLGTRAAVGRLIGPDDDRGPGNAVAVLNYDFWLRMFGGNPAALGTKISLNEYPFTIVGVAAAEFGGTAAGYPYDVWVPIATQRQTIPRMSEGVLANRAAGWINIFGRLKRGASIAEASADLNSIARQLAEAYPLTNKDRRVQVSSGLGWSPADRADLAGLLGRLAAAVLLLGVIGCANIAGLFSVRTAARTREIALRLAIGAGRGQVVRMLLAEGALIAATAAALGVLLTRWTAGLIASIRPFGTPRHLDAALDGRVLTFAIAAAILAALAFALLPSLRAIPPDLVGPLKYGTAGAGSRRPRSRALIGGQIAASFVLLSAGAMLVLDVARILRADAGYETKRLAMASLDLTLQRVPPDQGIAIYRRLSERLPAIPGVQSATLAMTVPPEEYPGRVSIFHPGQEPPPDVLMGREFQLGVRVDINRVAPRYFQTLGIRLLLGRDFTTHDDASGPVVAIVNQSLAQRMWPGEDPIGKRFSWPEWNAPRRAPLEVVGLAADTRSRSLAAPAVPVMYLPVFQNYDGRTRVVVRTAGDPAAAIAALQSAAREVNKNIVLYRPETMSEHVAQSIWAQRMAMAWIAAFGAMALFLSALGLYAAIAQSVSQRTREVGIRMALGAASGGVVRLIVREGLTVAAAGISVGLPIALAIDRKDPSACAAAAAVMLLVLLAAAWIPARRAAKVDPIESLRTE